VQVGDKVKRLLIILQGDVLADRAEVIAPMDGAGGLDAGEDFHIADCGLRIADSQNCFSIRNPKSAIRNWF
jgi:hypothetical protein